MDVIRFNLLLFVHLAALQAPLQLALAASGGRDAVAALRASLQPPPSQWTSSAVQRTCVSPPPGAGAQPQLQLERLVPPADAAVRRALAAAHPGLQRALADALAKLNEHSTSDAAVFLQLMLAVNGAFVGVYFEPAGGGQAGAAGGSVFKTAAGGKHFNYGRHLFESVAASQGDALYVLPSRCTGPKDANPVLLALFTRRVVARRQSSKLVVQLRTDRLSLDQCDAAAWTAPGAQTTPDANLSAPTTNQCHPELSTCTPSKSGGLSVDDYRCCCRGEPHVCFLGANLQRTPLLRSEWIDACGGQLTVRGGLRAAFALFNILCFLVALALGCVIRKKRNAQQQYGVRGWALMELLMVGAALLYLIVLLEYHVPPAAAQCAAAVWARQMGFAVFYGAVVLKIYRNLIEYRVRKAHHVYVKEKDMLKYLTCFVLLTLTGLVAWTLTVLQHGALAPLPTRWSSNSTAAGATGLAFSWSGQTDSSWSLLRPPAPDHWPPVPLCRLQYWAYAWQIYEHVFVLYGLWLCYRARNTTWVERWQFTLAVGLELCVSAAAGIARLSAWHARSADAQLLTSFLQVQLTVTVNIVVITMPKFYYVTLDYPDRPIAIGTGGAKSAGGAGGGTGGAPGAAGGAGGGAATGVDSAAAAAAAARTRAANWHQIREKLENGTIDLAVVPIHEMNPEDIRVSTGSRGGHDLTVESSPRNAWLLQQQAAAQTARQRPAAPPANSRPAAQHHGHQPADRDGAQPIRV